MIVEAVKKAEKGIGFNALTGEYVDMIKSGIVDPCKVTRSALQNAASIASMILTTEAVVADKPAKEAAPSAPGMGGGMPGMTSISQVSEPKTAWRFPPCGFFITGKQFSVRVLLFAVLRAESMVR